MAFGEDLYSKLSNDAGVSALVGARIYPSIFKQDADTPAIRYSRIGQTPFHLMGGDANIQRGMYQIDIIDKTFDGVDGVRQAVESALNRWSSTGVVQDSYLTNISDEYDDELRLYRIRMTYEFIIEV